jgi:hypothetical protein
MLASRLVILVVSAIEIATGRSSERGTFARQDDVLRVKLVQSATDYCAADSQIYSAELTLTAEYSNVSGQPVSVVTGSELADRVTVAATEADLTSKQSELQMDLESYPADARGTTLLGENLKRERAITVAPHGTLQSTLHISIPVRRTTENIPGALAPGRHVLVVGIRIRTANGPNPKSTSRWLSVTSQPVPIDLPSNPNVQACGE